MSGCSGGIARVGFLISCMTILAGQARSQDQIPNPGFENWTLGNPVGWFTNNGSTPVPTVIQSSTSHSGLSAVQGQVVHIGRTAALSPEVFTGFHVTNHNVALTGWYKFTPTSGDVLEIDLVMLAGTTRVGSGTLIVSLAESTYTQFNMPVIYQPGTAAPDSCTIIMFVSTATPGPVHIGSSMMLDDLAFVADNPLPIQLSSFTAMALSSGGVELQWTTLSELQNYGFEIQKRTVQDTGFQTLPGSFVPGHGTTNTPQQYSYIDETPGATSLFYRLRQISLDGAVSYTDPVQVSLTTSVTGPTTPVEFSLAQNYPNPFNPSTVIRYGLPQASDVRLEVFNALGQRVALLIDQKQAAGLHEAMFDGKALSSGAYVYTIQAGQFRATKKLLLVK